MSGTVIDLDGTETDVPAQPVNGWVRPRTRGELRDRLQRGETCEIVASNAEITGHMLRGWLEFAAFTVRCSPNPGWALFEPAPAAKAE